MKTLLFTLGLVLIAVCCCDAMPQALRRPAPGKCCFSFFDRRIPAKAVLKIVLTHSSCEHHGFIVETIKGKEICYSQDFDWAKTIYSQRHSKDGSSQQPLR